jgi:hypothetical protein
LLGCCGSGESWSGLAAWAITASVWRVSGESSQKRPSGAALKLLSDGAKPEKHDRQPGGNLESRLGSISFREKTARTRYQETMPLQSPRGGGGVAYTRICCHFGCRPVAMLRISGKMGELVPSDKVRWSHRTAGGQTHFQLLEVARCSAKRLREVFGR